MSLLLDYASSWPRTTTTSDQIGYRLGPGLDPPAGAAPAGSLYKSDPQAAAWRQNGGSGNRCLYLFTVDLMPVGEGAFLVVQEERGADQTDKSRDAGRLFSERLLRQISA